MHKKLRQSVQEKSRLDTIYKEVLDVYEE